MIRLAAAILLLGATGAHAQGTPAVQPSRDVDVTYRVPVPGAGDSSLLQRLRWSAIARRQRVDLPTSGNWMVLDFKTHRMAMVQEDARTVVDLPGPPDPAVPGTGFTRLGGMQVAGLPCTEWRTLDSRGGDTIACYTADGVLLRARSGDRTLMEAVAVTYANQPAAVFEVPAGYVHQDGHQ